MGLNVTRRETEPGIITILPVGAIDSDTHQLLDTEIDAIVAEPVKTVVIDMAGVDFISSAGVGTIAKAKASLNRRGANLAMINLQPQVKRVFEIVRLLPALNVFESREELDEYLGKVQRRMTGREDQF